MATQVQLEVILAENRKKETIKTKTKSGNCFYIHLVLKIKPRLIVMSTNLENRKRERQIKRKIKRQASEAQREKERQRARDSGHKVKN